MHVTATHLITYLLVHIIDVHHAHASRRQWPRGETSATKRMISWLQTDLYCRLQKIRRGLGFQVRNPRQSPSQPGPRAPFKQGQPHSGTPILALLPHYAHPPRAHRPAAEIRATTGIWINLYSPVSGMTVNNSVGKQQIKWRMIIPADSQSIKPPLWRTR